MEDELEGKLSEEDKKAIKEENRKRWKAIFTSIIIFIVVIFLIIYWFIPINTTNFGNLKGSINYNFTTNDFEKMQFYENMRYPNSQISYKINNCTIEKQNEIEWAFDIIESKTYLEFYPIKEYEEISVYCQERNKMKEGMFIGGEGGPTEIIKSGNFNVISSGSILLIRNSKCERPNIAIHELLHALGFAHSENPNSIMYPILNCDQIIGEDIYKLLNELYSVPSYPDLSIENASAIMYGKYLDINVTVRNNGLDRSKKAKINVLANDKNIQEITLEPLGIGEGMSVLMEDIWVPKIIINEINFCIDYPYEELEEKNNKISLR